MDRRPVFYRLSFLALLLGLSLVERAGGPPHPRGSTRPGALPRR